MYTKHVKAKFLLALLFGLMFYLVNLPIPVAAESELNFRWILPPEFYRGNDFHNNRAWVQREQGGPWTLFDSEGNIIKDGFLARNVIQSSLANTRFIALEQDYETGWDMVGFLDDSGNILLEPQFDFLSFQEGISVKRGENGLWGFIDFQGNWVIPSVYEDTDVFWLDELMAVRKNGQWGFINRSGEVVIDFQFESVLVGFASGLSFASQNSLWGLIDIKGNWLTEAIYEKFFFPWSHLPAVQKDGRIGFLDSSGNLAIDFKFPGLDEWETGYATFSDGRATLLTFEEEGTEGVIARRLLHALFSGERRISETNYRWIVINETGEIIPTKEYDYVFPYSDGFAVAARDNRWFMLDREGNEHSLPPEFIQSEAMIILPSVYGIFRVQFTRENRMGYFRVRD